MARRKRDTFRARLCFWVFNIAIVCFLLIFGFTYYYVSSELRRDVRATANAQLDNVIYSLDAGLTNTEVSSQNFLGVMRSPLVPNRRDSIYFMFEHFLMDNPRVSGIAIGYMKGEVKGHEDGFCPYVTRLKDGTFVRKDLATIKDYRGAQWFKHTVESRKTNWSAPFRETYGRIITSYNIPITNDKGEIFAVMAVDLDLNLFNNHIQSMKPYPHSILTVVDDDGVIIAHPNPDYILVESISSLLLKAGENANHAMWDSIEEGKRGDGTYKSVRGRTYVYYAPESKTGWTIILETPESDITTGLVHLRNILILIMVLGVALLTLVSYVAITRMTRPLEQFAHVARGISHGNFNRPLPETKVKNELSDLHDALASMKTSITTYIQKLQETTKSKAIIESELNTARKIQMAMVPKIFPPYPDRKELDIFGSLTPAKAVGGDLYDFILMGDEFYFCIGDVSGKGVPASLFMAITRSLFRNNVTHAKSPAAIATLLNNAIAQGNDENMFVTMFIGCCNLTTGMFRCCNCGHNAPATNGDIDDLKTMSVKPTQNARFMSHVPVNLPIGVVEGFEFKEVSMQLKPGIKIMLYTDGVTEAENREAKLYGDDRLIEKLSQLPDNATAQEAVNFIIEDVHRHADGAIQSDDITMLCMQFLQKK